MLEAQADFQVVAECGDGEEALAAIERERPDVALLDVDMPKQDGFAVVRALRERGVATAVVLLTMHARDDLLREAFSQGVRGYVVKDGAVLDVVHAIREVLAGAAVHQLEPVGHPADGPTPPTPASRPSCSGSPRPRCGCCASSPSSSPARRSPSELGVHYRTVENHRTSIAGKLGLVGSHALSRYAALHRDRLK